MRYFAAVARAVSPIAFTILASCASTTGSAAAGASNMSTGADLPPFSLGTLTTGPAPHQLAAMNTAADVIGSMGWRVLSIAPERHQVLTDWVYLDWRSSDSFQKGLNVRCFTNATVGVRLVFGPVPGDDRPMGVFAEMLFPKQIAGLSGEARRETERLARSVFSETASRLREALKNNGEMPDTLAAQVGSGLDDGSGMMRTSGGVSVYNNCIRMTR